MCHCKLPKKKQGTKRKTANAPESPKISLNVWWICHSTAIQPESFSPFLPLTQKRNMSTLNQKIQPGSG